MNYETLLYEQEGGMAVVTLNRPDRLNALNDQLKSELFDVFDRMEKDESVRVAILTGGEKVFSSGADIRERAGLFTQSLSFYGDRKKTHRVFNRIENFRGPVIAAISGVAVGGGCELALVCDLRIASETARFGLREVKIGSIPGGGGTQRLPRLIGIARAKELLFTGEFVDAQEAYRLGLVNRVVSEESLMDETRHLAQKLLNNAPLSLEFVKRTVNVGMRLDLESALDFEAQCASILASSEDRIEGFNAFLEKRKPNFRGR